jgi:hypothetical protein
LAACDKCDPLLDADESTACKFACRGISSGAIAAQSIGIHVFSIHPQRNDLIPHSLRISSAPPLAWMRCSGRSRAIWRTNWRTTGDNVIEGRHIDLADNGWQQATGTTLAAADSSKGRRATADDGGEQRQRWQWRKQEEGCGWSPAEEGSARRAAADDSGSAL